MTFAVIAIVWVLCAGFSAMIASSKGRSVGEFAIAGLFLGVFGLLWAAFATPQAELDRRADNAIKEATTRKHDTPWMDREGA
jgi:hypothetical protein